MNALAHQETSHLDTRRLPQPTIEALVSSGVTPDEASLWIAEVEALRASCGCETGTRLMVWALFLYPCFWFWKLRSLHLSPWVAVLIGVIVIVAAAVAGKLTGLFVAQLRLRSRLVQMERLVGRAHS